METIKHSRIIIVLLILYIGISILVVTMDNSQRKSKSSTNTKQNDDSSQELDEFISDIKSITDSVISYVTDNNFTSDVCVPLSFVLGDEYSGSAYVNKDRTSVKLWYSNNTYTVNNIETLAEEISKDSVEEEYNTEFYGSCGLNQ